jgi:hypothetical protein
MLVDLVKSQLGDVTKSKLHSCSISHMQICVATEQILVATLPRWKILVWAEEEAGNRPASHHVYVLLRHTYVRMGLWADQGAGKWLRLVVSSLARLLLITASTGLDHQVKELVIMNQLCLVPPKAARQCVQQITTAGDTC